MYVLVKYFVSEKQGTPEFKRTVGYDDCTQGLKQKG